MFSGCMDGFDGASRLVFISNRIKRLRYVTCKRIMSPLCSHEYAHCVLWIYNSRLPQSRTSQSGLSVNVMSHWRYPFAYGVEVRFSLAFECPMSRDSIAVSFRIRTGRPGHFTFSASVIHDPQFSCDLLGLSWIKKKKLYSLLAIENIFLSNLLHITPTPTPIVITRKVGLATRAAWANMYDSFSPFLSFSSFQ